MSLAAGFPRFKAEPTLKPARKRLPRVGKKMRRDRAEIKALMPALLERSHGRCEARCSRYCRAVAEHPHHVRQRSLGGKNTLDNVLHVCGCCHSQIHDLHETSIAMGFLR